MTGGKVRQYPYFDGRFHTSTPLRSVELSKEWQRVHDWGKVRQYPFFVRLLHTSTPLRSVELSKRWRNSGFHGQGWTWLTNLEARATQLKCLGDQRALSFRSGHPSVNAGEPEIFPSAQPCSPVVIGSMIHYMLLFNVEVHFLRTLVKGMQILVNHSKHLHIRTHDFGGLADWVLIYWVLNDKSPSKCY